MDKENANCTRAHTHTHKGIFFTAIVTTQWNLEDIRVSEMSQSQKDKYPRVPLI